LKSGGFTVQDLVVNKMPAKDKTEWTWHGWVRKAGSWRSMVP
jgi:hypothetical protein